MAGSGQILTRFSEPLLSRKHSCWRPAAHLQPLQRRLGPADVASGVEEQAGPACSERIPTENERSHNTAHHVGDCVSRIKERDGAHIGPGGCNTAGDTHHMRTATLTTVLEGLFGSAGAPKEYCLTAERRFDGPI
jgi:hypothetical protein